MYPSYKLIQIVEVPQNGESSPYAVKFYGQMEYFEFDFMCKSALKKFFVNHKIKDGNYLIIHDNELSGYAYVVDVVCNYHTKGSGHFLDFKLPGQKWIDLVNNVMERIEVIDIGLKIHTSNKINITKIVDDSVEK